MTLWGSASLLRARDGEEAKVSYVELFFDLVYVFAVTQLSHRLLGDLSALGAVQSLVLWFAVWLCWQYTCWVTNWFDPEALPLRLLLFAIALLGLVMSSSIPAAFATRGLVFAACYVLIQVGRTTFVLLHLGPRHELSANFRRMLIWLCISGALWIAGGLAGSGPRLLLWILAVLCEYVSPMTGFRLPFLGRSRTSDWTIEGGHLAERCQLFVIIALGESLLATGASLSQSEVWSAPVLIAFAITFLGTVALWWMYFDTSSKAGSEAIVASPDPGRIGAYFHYVHVTIVAGVIVMAVANDLVIAHAHARPDAAELAVLVAGPGIFMLGNGVYQAIVYGRFPLSHLVGLGGLLAVLGLGLVTDLLMLGGAVSLLLVAVAAWNGLARRHPA